jgi:hypothetical protein
MTVGELIQALQNVDDPEATVVVSFDGHAVQGVVKTRDTPGLVILMIGE